MKAKHYFPCLELRLPLFLKFVSFSTGIQKLTKLNCEDYLKDCYVILNKTKGPLTQASFAYKNLMYICFVTHKLPQVKIPCDVAMTNLTRTTLKLHPFYTAGLQKRLSATGSALSVSVKSITTGLLTYTPHLGNRIS